MENASVQTRLSRFDQTPRRNISTRLMASCDIVDGAGREKQAPNLTQEPFFSFKTLATKIATHRLRVLKHV